jgi:hypothetical protein
VEPIGHHANPDDRCPRGYGDGNDREVSSRILRSSKLVAPTSPRVGVLDYRRLGTALWRRLRAALYASVGSHQTAIDFRV